jgi:hypothetical protein
MVRFSSPLGCTSILSPIWRVAAKGSRSLRASSSSGAGVKKKKYKFTVLPGA